MKRLLLLALTAWLLSPIATNAEVDKTRKSKVRIELDKLKDSQFVDFGKARNKSAENTNKEGSVLNHSSRYPDSFDYKGKLYIASRVCEEGTVMRWSITPRLFARALIEEIGCMTDRENERYWRNYKMHQNNRPIIINNPPPTYTQPQRTTVIQNNYDYGY